MGEAAIPIAILRALRHLEAHPRILSAKPVPALSSEVFVAEIEVDSALPSRWRAAGQSPNGVKSVETVAVIFPPEFPAAAPRFFLRADFDRSHPHLQPVVHGLPEPCLLNGSTSELMRSQGICALADQLALWLERAARVQLIDPVQGWEPVRRDHIDDIIIADPAALRAMVTPTSGCTALWSHFMSEADAARRLHHIVVGVEPATIAGDLLKALEGQRAQQCLTLVAWSGKSPSGEPVVAGRYLPENIGDFGGLLARAKELGCHEQLTAKLNLISLRLKGNRLRSIVPLGVILIARRPCDVIGQGSPLEICPYVLELTGDDLLSYPGTPVRMAGQRDLISANLLARASGGTRGADVKKWVLLGCGSVGSKLALHLVRAGVGPAQVVDRSTMSPHNFARHALVPWSPIDAGLLRQKADLLADAVSSFGQVCTPAQGDIVTNAMANKALAPAATTLIVNATGSLTVRESLCRQDIARPRIAECCLMGIGRIGYMAIEGASSNPSIADLVTEAYRLMASDDEIRSLVFAAPPTDIAIGVGCSSLTFPMSDARLSALTAPMAERLGRLLDEPHPTADGELLLGSTPEDGLGQRWTRAQVPPFREVTVARYRTRISDRVHDMIEKEVALKPGVETGGIIIGRWSDLTDTFHVVDLLPAPPDSAYSPQEFTLGVEGLRTALDDIVERSGGSLYALGTWHNHLVTSQASGLDKRTAALLALNQFFPALLLIHLPSGYTAVAAEALLQNGGNHK
jgi:Prokaryotic E2 family A/ThiF family